MGETEKKSAKAVLRYLRVSPRKVRHVIDTIRYKPLYQAFSILSSIKKKGARMTEKLLTSAAANAKVLGLEEKRLYVSKVFADGGPTLKRFRSRSMGRADRILKRTTHISIMLSEGTKAYKKPGEEMPKEAKEEVLKPKKKTRKASAGKT